MDDVLGSSECGELSISDVALTRRQFLAKSARVAADAGLGLSARGLTNRLSHSHE